MVQILPIASGKGGVGKSAVSLNLAVALAQKGKKVILCDFDFGGANLHTMLGHKNNKPGLGHFINKLEDHLLPLIQETSIPNLGFIAGDCLFPGTPNMDYFSKKKIIKELKTLETDYVILDLGAGSTFNTLDFYLTTYKSILVTTPEITSILNAYSFLKSAVFRFFASQFPARSEQRKLIQNFTHNRLEGSELSFLTILDEITNKFPESGEKAIEELKLFRPQVILNKGKESADIAMGQRLKSLVKNKLNMNMDFIGFIPNDEQVSYSIARRTPLLLTNPDSSFSKRIYPIADRILASDFNLNETLLDSDDNLEDLIKEFNEE